MTKGKLIVLDGLDGSGKSTQLELAADYLQKKGVKFRSVSFPNYNTASGQLISEYLAGSIKCEGICGAYAASAIYAVDRYASCTADWGEFYRSGGLVLTGRYTTSNAIYQLAKMPKEKYNDFLSWLFDFEYNKFGLPKPDKVIFLDMPVEVSQKLLEKRYNGDESRKDIHESNVHFLKQCRESALYSAESCGWSVVRCAEGNEPLSIEVIHRQICKIIDEMI